MYNSVIIAITMRLIIILLTITYCDAASFNRNLVILDARRTIDLTSQLVRVTTKLKVQNTGEEEIKELGWIPERGKEANLSHIIAKCEKQNIGVNEKKIDGIHFFEVRLLDILKKGDSVGLVVEEIYTKLLTPFPSKIKQKDNQLVLYEGNAYLYTPYVVLVQSTIVLTGKKVESYTNFKPFTYFNNRIEYGAYKNITPFAFKRVSIHYENNSPFLTVTNLLRTVEISHWGSVSVVDKISLKHTGARLTGPFSRFDLQHFANNGPSSVQSFVTLLPASAENIFYRDDIGNISSSMVSQERDFVEVQIAPRFPLFGGWKTVYSIGYSVPGYEHLFSKSDNYYFSFRFIDHVFDEMHVESFLARIILPPGARNIKLKTPYPIDRLPDTLEFKPLDPVGRTVLNLAKKNLVDAHIQDFEIEYEWCYSTMLYSVVRYIAAFYLLFLCYIVYIRLDFSFQTAVKLKKV